MYRSWVPTKIEAFVKKDVDFGSNSTFNFGDSSKEEEEDKKIVPVR